MFQPTTMASPPRIVATLPGVPESQARALDRRRRLDRQLRSFRQADRPAASRVIVPAGPGPA